MKRGVETLSFIFVSENHEAGLIKIIVAFFVIISKLKMLNILFR
jgi:hypothetical protein